MTCSRGRPGRRPCLSRAASSVCSTRPDRGEARDATPQQGCKAGNKNRYVTISFSCKYIKGNEGCNFERRTC